MMPWDSQFVPPKPTAYAQISTASPRPSVPMSKIDYRTLITVDFETHWDADYTLRKLSTSEYVRDERFRAQMMGIKVGTARSRIIKPNGIQAALDAIDWSSHALLAHNCLHGDVEILTPNGWIAIRDAQANNRVMQWNPKTEEMSWCNPLAKTIGIAKTLLHWNTQLHSVAYTPEHRMYFNTPDKNGWRADTARNIQTRSQNNTYIPLAGTYVSKLPIQLSVEEAQLMEAIRADGSWTITDGVCYGAQFRLKKTRKQQRLRALAEALGLPTQEMLYGDVNQIRFTTSSTIRRLFDLLGCEKQYGRWVLELTPTIRTAILDEARYWDGSPAKARSSFTWSCANESTVEAFQLMAHMTGRSMSGKWTDNARGFNEGNVGAKLYRANIAKKTRAKLVVAPIEKEHNDTVFCLTVPTGAFVIRSNGQVTITGNCAFDGLILSHHYGVVPSFYCDTLSMARGLHSNDIGAGLDEVARYYGVGNKLEGALEAAKGIRDLPTKLYAKMAAYCKQDVELTIAIFKLMCQQFPHSELQLVDQIIRMFCDPVLMIDRERVAAEHAREVEHKKSLILSVLSKEDKKVGTEEEQLAKGKKVIGSRDGYVALLKDAGVEPPTKLNKHGETAFAFAKTDIEFTALLEHPKKRVRELVEARLGVKSSINETRAVRFLEATRDGHRLPMGYGYYRAHTGRLGGSNKMNMQNLNRGGELRRSIQAPRGYVLPVCDSGQIEARLNGWLWGQDDLMQEFRDSDAKIDRDPYCKFADVIYHRVITKADETERYIAKTGVLGLGFQMGAPKFQYTLASGAKGPPEFLELEQCYEIVNAYRKKNHRIVWGWSFCRDTILPDLYAGRSNSYKCLHWEKERIWLPNGMCLKYPGLRPHKQEDSSRVDWTYESKGVPKKIFGGLLTENIIQALARIVISDQLLEIAKEDRIVMMTHDENVALVKIRRGPAALKRMLKIMSTPPAWCADIPLIADGSCEAYYSK